jgi:hypothetical protein
MKRIAMLVALVALALPSVATAGNSGDSRLDAISSAIAGHPVGVYCENDWVEWYNIFRVDQGTLGFTASTVTTIFLNPRECATLRGWLLNGNSEDMGAYWFSLAILVTIHESIHQRLYPQNITLARNEAYVECLALKEFRDDATRFFGVPVNVPQLSVKPVVKKIKVGKVTRRVTTWVPITISIANPYLIRLDNYAHGWDATMPSNYHGATC